MFELGGAYKREHACLRERRRCKAFDRLMVQPPLCRAHRLTELGREAKEESNGEGREPSDIIRRGKLYFKSRLFRGCERHYKPAIDTVKRSDIGGRGFRQWNCFNKTVLGYKALEEWPIGKLSKVP